MKWDSLFFKINHRDQVENQTEEREYIYGEVIEAHKEWERAHEAFQSAMGKEEVDVAIYMLEAAERRYQIRLKEAKKLEIHLIKHSYLYHQANLPVRRLGS